MSNELKVGDTVRVIAAGDCLEGREGVITYYDSDTRNWPWSIKFNNGHSNVYDTVDLELVKNTFFVYDETTADVTAMFTTLEDAINDARGAAKECLGTFQVFKLVKSFTGAQEAVVVVEKDHN
jgi:hypothetical protein